MAAVPLEICDKLGFCAYLKTIVHTNMYLEFINIVTGKSLSYFRDLSMIMFLILDLALSCQCLVCVHFCEIIGIL